VTIFGQARTIGRKAKGDRPMSFVVFEHVKVGELPEEWRKRIAASDDARVTVRIEPESIPSQDQPADAFASDDPAFGIWRDRDDMLDVEEYLRKLRAPRYGQK
jgi:diaminopimelate decarboxylase